MSLIFLQGLAWVSKEPERRESPVLAQTVVPSSKAVTHGPLSGNGERSREQSRRQTIGTDLTGAFWLIWEPHM